jgi:hypothetical protein
MERGRSRGVSEFTGVAILITFTVLITASVGLAVLVEQPGPEGPPGGNFTFEYFDRSSSMLITFDRGDQITASNLTVRSERGSAAWYELAGSESNATVGPGASIQISGRNAYDADVRSGDRIEVVYTGGNGTVVLDSDTAGG